MKKLMLALLVLVILVNGCDTSGPSPEATNYHTGTQGITMNFMTNSPPSNLYHGDNSVPFGLEIRNLGTTTTNPYIWITGHDRQIVNINWDARRPGNIEGKSELYPMGGYSTLETDNVRINLPNEVDQYSANMKITACYTYSTKASAQICVDPDPTRNQDDACSATSVGLSGGQGGPVAITHVKQEPSSGGNVMFTITVQNVGDGTIISSDKVSKCVTDLRVSDIDQLTVSSIKMSNIAVTCSNTNPVRLMNGRGTIYCRASGLKGNAFTTALQLTLNYGYKSSISKTINVRRV